jgi:hypothetical protein
MKLFSVTLHGNAREWYDDLHDASITSMDQLEETFIKRWGIKLKDIQMLLNRFEYIKQAKNEIVREFQDRFENLLWKIPISHQTQEKYLSYLYTNALVVHLGFLLGKNNSKTLNETYNMAIEIKENISLFKGRHLFTPDTLILETIVSIGTFTGIFQEKVEQVINRQEFEEKDRSEVFQSHEEKQEITHFYAKDNEDVVEEREPEDIKHDDEVLMYVAPSDESIQDPIPSV